MPSGEVKSEAQCAAYPFGGDGIVAPEEFNPDGFAGKPTVGTHKMKVVSFEVEVAHSFKHKDEFATLNQLRPTLEVIDGPSAGARIMDFLPLPTPNQPMPAPFANRWGNFVKGLGFELPKDANGRQLLAPAGFKLTDIKDRPVLVKITQGTNADGTPKMFRGEPDTQVAFFGYSAATKGAPPAAAEAWDAGTPAGKTAPKPKAKKGADDFDL